MSVSPDIDVRVSIKNVVQAVREVHEPTVDNNLRRSVDNFLRGEPTVSARLIVLALSANAMLSRVIALRT